MARLPCRRAWSHGLRVLIAGLVVGALGGCRADLTVAVRATAEGGGDVSATVSLDKEAAEQVPDLGEQLRVDDLKAAGWRIVGPGPAPGGRTNVRAVKAFGSPSEATQVLRELSGADGPFGSLRLNRTRSLLKTRTSLAGAVDLAAGLESFSDEVLKEKLGGSAFGVDLAQLEAELGKPLADIFGFRLVADLPGELEGKAPAVWQVRLGQTTPVRAVAEQWNLTTIAAGASAAAGLALIVILVGRRYPRRHRRRH